MAAITINGAIRGAYKDEPTFDVEGEGIVGLTQLLQMILGGDAEADGNGIYSGSGNVPNATVANVAGTLKFESTADDGSIEIRVDDEAGRNSFYQVDRFGSIIETNGIDDAGKTQIETTKDRIFLRSQGDGDALFEIEVNDRSIRMNTLPVYANDAAANVDSTLQAKSIYLTTGSNTLKIKL